MKYGKCLHYFDRCVIKERCIYKKDGECKRNGVIEQREFDPELKPKIIINSGYDEMRYLV